jgi:class 3 adenylate cyclase/TolB-like protein
MSEERRLAAIMFTDIVGYTALMGRDEDNALKILRMNRQVHQQCVNNHRGILLKEMGDGTLARFDSATEAVQCAIQIQKIAHNELKGRIRIGIHLGDVTFENEDVFGDGVNIASRLESAADPGGIYISESIQKAIRAKTHIETTYLGEFKLKNVEEPVRTWAIVGDGLPLPSQARVRRLQGKSIPRQIFRSLYTYLIALAVIVVSIWSLRKNLNTVQLETASLLVLPVENYIGSDTLEYLTAGIHSSLISDMGRISAFRVPSQTTARAYKESGKSLKEISEELKVNYVIEPSLTCMGDSLCLHIRLIGTGVEEKQILEQDYQVDRSQIMNFYNQVTSEVSEKLKVFLTQDDRNLLVEDRTIDDDAYDAYLKGRYNWERVGKADMDRALRYFQIATEKAPDWGPPYAGIASVWAARMQMGFVLPSVAIPLIHENLDKALELDPNSANSHSRAAGVAAWTEWNWEKAEREFLRATELNPNEPQTQIYYGHLLMNMRRIDEAVKQAKIALDLDPLDALILALSAVIMSDAGMESLALEQTTKALSIDPDHWFARGIHEMLLYQNGNYKESIEFFLSEKNFQLERVDLSGADTLFDENWYRNVFPIVLKSLEKLVSDEGFITVYDLANYSLRLDKTEEALNWLEKGYEMHDPNMPYIRNSFFYSHLKDNPRYINLLEKMNLPVK